MKGNKILFGLLFLGTILVGQLFSASAQSKPEIFSTWTTSSYAPNDYTGKVLPSVGSTIRVSFEAVSGGKVLNLSKQMVYWYLNDNLAASGEGVQDISFKAVQGGVLNVRIQASSPAGIINHSISIPVIEPEVAIKSPAPGGLVSGNNFQLEARPYFFNVGDISGLDFTWKVNGKAPTNNDNPRFLNIEVGSEAAAGFQISVSLTARTKGLYPESASRSAKFSIDN